MGIRRNKSKSRDPTDGLMQTRKGDKRKKQMELLIEAYGYRPTHRQLYKNQVPEPRDAQLAEKYWQKHCGKVKQPTADWYPGKGNGPINLRGGDKAERIKPDSSRMISKNGRIWKKKRRDPRGR